jgi:hypothetical protein
MSQSEVIAQLAQRRSGRVAQPMRRRVHSADAAEAPNRRVAAGHKFHVGQTVTLVPNYYGANRHVSFKVTWLLPQEHGVNQYRLKSVVDGHERVAMEGELI